MTGAITLDAAGFPGKWVDRLIHSPVGDLIARPWVDPVGLAALKRWYFPLSRLWAAANVADGSTDAFRAVIGGAVPDYRRWSTRYLETILKRHDANRQRAITARGLWEQAAFGEAAITLARVEGLEAHARSVAIRLNR